MAEGWTLETLKEHLTAKIDGLEKYTTDLSAAAKEAISAAMTASEKAILKAEVSADKRAEASNEIRAAMIDQQKFFANREQTEFRLGAIDIKLGELERTIAASGGKAQGFSSLAGIISQVIAAVVGGVAVYVALRG